MPEGRARRIAASLAGAAVVLVALLASSVPAAATQSAPAWTTGDYWEYTVTGSSGSGTARVSVEERTSVALPGGTYPAFHVVVRSDLQAPNGSAVSDRNDFWIRDSDLGIVKRTGVTSWGDPYTVTYDPPLTTADFPLEIGPYIRSWGGTSTVREEGNLNGTMTLDWDGWCAAEGRVVVPAGAFAAATIWMPVYNPIYTYETSLARYSEAVGYYVLVEIEDRDSNVLVRQELTAYRYSTATLRPLLVVGGLVAIVALVAASAVILRRRARRATRPSPRESAKP